MMKTQPRAAEALRSHRLVLLAALAGLGLAATPQALARDGAQPAAREAAASGALPAAVELAGQRLLLQGSGTRYKAVFSVYEAGLYASGPVQSLDDLLALPGPKAFRLVARRNLSTDELGRMLVRGLQESNPAQEVRQQMAGMAQVGGMFGSRTLVAQGDTFGFHYLPGTGTVLLVNDKPVGDAVRDPAFFTLLMRIWLGPQPVDVRLKGELLGGPGAARPPRNSL